MLTLVLLRHAKSSWSDADLEDRDRPLAKRGTRAIPAVARYMREKGLTPDVVLCSPAVRTRATLTLLLSEFEGAPPMVIYENELYLAEPPAILSLVREQPRTAKTVMVVGHNPGLHALALELTGKGDRKLIGSMAREFPTAALAAVRFEAEAWSEVGTALGTLEHFTTPRRLYSR